MHALLPRSARLHTLTFIALLAATVACSTPPSEEAAPQGAGGSAMPTTGGTSSTGGTTSTGGTPATETGGSVSTGGEPTNGDGWKLVWSDEFDGEGLPSSENWSFETQGPGWVNSELQAYTGARTENARLENGSLIIEARRDNFGGNEYSSARIHTAGKHEFTYGRFEARAKLPEGRGTWPAIWMMPGDVFKYATTCTAQTGWVAGCDAWPNSGEIDIMEHVGHDPGNVHSTIHCQKYNWQRPEQKTSTIAVTDVFNTFHVYAVERYPDRIDAFVDDQKYFTFQNEGSGWQAWPFDMPFYFILNIAVGGSWGGAQGVDPNIFPQRMEIDYVRAYELVTP